MKQPTIADLYFSDDYIGTPGVAKGLLEMAAEGDPSYEINKHSDGSESVFYKMDSGLSYYIGTNDKSSDVLVAEVGASKLPPSAYSGEMPQTTMTDTGGGAAIGFRPALPKRPTGGDLEVPMNPFARVIAKGANWFGDQVDKGATLYDTMQLIIPGGFDPDAKMNLPTDFKPRPSQINPATGQMIPATMGFDPKEVTVGEVLKAIPVSEVIGVRGLARLAESLGTGNLPSFGDLLDSAGLWPVGSGTAGVLKATVGTAKNIAKELAPVAGEMAIKSMEKLGTPVQMNIVPPGPNTVSTRLPTAVKATEDPLANNLSIDFEAVKSDPEAFKYNMGLIQQYPNFASKARNPEKRAEDFIDEVKNNLLYLYDNVPEQTRERSKLWYDGARNITTKWSEQYQIPDQAVSGVLAVLSPQKDWFMNVSLGQRVLDIMGTKQTTKWDNTMSEMAKVIWSKPQYAPMVDSIKGKALDEITDPGLKAMWLRTYDQAYNPREHQIVTPEGDFAGLRMNADGKTPTKTGWGSLNEIGKAIVILEDPSKASISNNLGAMHKVRNFYNNIYAPNDPSGAVTIDTHAVAAGLLRPLSGNSREVLHNFGSGITGEGGPKNSSITGVQGTYGIYAEAYRRAAQERGVLPREMQSITWEAVRGLFPDTFKSQAKNVDQVDGIWLKYRKGQLSLDEARNEVFNAAGGINPPEWEGAGLRVGTTPEVQAPINQGELPGTGVSRGITQGLGSGKRNGTPRAIPQGNGINLNQPGQSSGGIE